MTDRAGRPRRCRPARTPADASADLTLFLDLLPDHPLRDVPDPYYEDGFDTVLDLIEHGCDALIRRMR